MATEYTTVELWVKVDAEGQYEVGTTSEEAMERYTENICDDTSGMDGFRMVKVYVKVPLPTIMECVAELAEDATATATAK